MLTPLVVITPQIKTVDDFTTSLWTAVELTTQVCRPGVASSPVSAQSEDWRANLCPSQRDRLGVLSLHH